MPPQETTGTERSWIVRTQDQFLGWHRQNPTADPAWRTNRKYLCNLEGKRTTSILSFKTIRWWLTSTNSSLNRIFSRINNNPPWNHHHKTLSTTPKTLMLWTGMTSRRKLGRGWWGLLTQGSFHKGRKFWSIRWSAMKQRGHKLSITMIHIKLWMELSRTSQEGCSLTILVTL